MKILFIAPLPPPIDGQSKASKFLLDKLLFDENELTIINYTKKSRIKSSINFIKRSFHILYILFQVFQKKNRKDLIYLSLAESYFGNIRDLFIYTICRDKIDRFILHMLGGAGMEKILKSEGLIKRLNNYYISRVSGVIVEGNSNFNLFRTVIEESKIHIVPNFAEEYLFVKKEDVLNKFSKFEKISILYLSNMLPGKGYLEIVEAYNILDGSNKSKIKITFVGAFQSSQDKAYFLDLISDNDNILYIGDFIDGENKKRLFSENHIFCLPTYYPYEGQPISILEAYASGLVVITTNHSGISYVFSDRINGYLAEKKSVDSLKMIFEEIIADQDKLRFYALNNLSEAEKKYRLSSYESKIKDAFNKSIR